METKIYQEVILLTATNNNKLIYYNSVSRYFIIKRTEEASYIIKKYIPKKIFLDLIDLKIINVETTISISIEDLENIITKNDLQRRQLGKHCHYCQFRKTPCQDFKKFFLCGLELKPGKFKDIINYYN